MMDDQSTLESTLARSEQSSKAALKAASAPLFLLRAEALPRKEPMEDVKIPYKDLSDMQIRSAKVIERSRNKLQAAFSALGLDRVVAGVRSLHMRRRGWND